MGKIVILANRLAESILMNWDEEEVIKLAKEVAVACKENIDLTCLVKRMREAQKERDSLSSKITFLTEEDTRIRANSIRKTMSLESEVDEYLKKMEDLK